MKTHQINGMEVVALHDVSDATGVSYDALRQRIKRGLLDIEPVITFGTNHFYDAAQVRHYLRAELRGVA